MRISLDLARRLSEASAVSIVSDNHRSHVSSKTTSTIQRSTTRRGARSTILTSPRNYFDRWDTSSPTRSPFRRGYCPSSPTTVLPANERQDDSESCRCLVESSSLPRKPVRRASLDSQNSPEVLANVWSTATHDKLPVRKDSPHPKKEMSNKRQVLEASDSAFPKLNSECILPYTPLLNGSSSDDSTRILPRKPSRRISFMDCQEESFSQCSLHLQDMPFSSRAKADDAPLPSFKLEPHAGKTERSLPMPLFACF